MKKTYVQIWTERFILKFTMLFNELLIQLHFVKPRIYKKWLNMGQTGVPLHPLKN